MFTIPSFKLPSLSLAKSRFPTIDFPAVEIHDVETAAEKRPRTLKHLLKANHANYSIIYHELRFHNHCSHILGSAYILGATHEHLNDIYDKEASELEPWRDAPGEISKDDWRDFLGKREYQRAFVDFFEDQLVVKGYDWKSLLHEYLYEGDEPLINNMISGLGHSLIHLGYAYELNSRTVAIEALAIGSCFHNGLHKYLDDPSYTKPSPKQSSSLLEILEQVKNDKRFDGLYDHQNGDMSKIFEKQEGAFLEYWNAWDLSDPKEQFKESQKTATAVLMATPGATHADYDFFFVHLLTTSHAVRILLPLVPAKYHISLVRQWWLLTLAVYISQTRPDIELGRIEKYDLKGQDWKFVVNKALASPRSLDAHFVKALRAMKVASETWGDASQFYLKSAVKLADEFEDWGGFGPEDDVVLYHPGQSSNQLNI
ncbi:hypothetical protein EJ04DRAFT_527144 [Polyplosphaeria fusca]|uniref:MGS207 protein n=1 Tax=Polyplosphaeria fusca TaxID=682080 RepID=A0A9P4QPM7_9PLEO|nr:hypothetical protein EJ04DRAFT_527144 [Polyplosphaeria fusca]